ncbi:ROK family transcriptional regulator [Rhodococcus sp. NPDC049939]|uniref:ROK family transcriptional regulator n=1 Tax=Rhodococcus sp. NPDC049939 TaxID=3155511 RepID=UPI0033DACEE0
MARSSDVYRRGSAPAAAPLPRTLAQLTDDAFLDVLFREGPSSRAQIAKATGISKPTISESAQRLLGSGLIIEVGQTSTGMRGRSATLCDVNPRYGHTLGVVLERGYVAVRALDHKGSVVCENQVEADDEDLPTAISDTRDLIARCFADVGTPLLATAISVAAPIDPRTHTVQQLPDAPFTGSVPDFARALQIEPVAPLLVDNDVNWATIAESRIGSMQDADDFLYVYLGAGIGAGLFLSGGLHRGSNGTAGEIGFLRTASGETLLHRLGHSSIGTPDGRSIDLERARELLRTDTPGHTVDEILDDLAHTIVNVATAVDPGRIAIGGPLSQMNRVTEGLRERIERTALSEVEMTISPLGRTAPLQGAAIGALELARKLRTRLAPRTDCPPSGHRS